MEYETHYRKGFPVKENWERFVAAVHAGDIYNQNQSIQSDRAPVDCSIFALDQPDKNILKVHTMDDSVENDDIMFVQDLVPLRDIQLDQLDSSVPDEYKTVSWFLRNYEQTTYAPGVDYIQDQSNWDNIMAGGNPLETQQLGPTRGIETGRDLARLVHDDNPMTFMMDVYGQLKGEGVVFNAPDCILAADSARFVTFGDPCMFGLLGEALRRCGYISFMLKWQYFVARPEQASVDRGMGFIPATFVEGSPTHPSRGAMHSNAYLTMCYLLEALCDGNHVLPSGNTVSQELEFFSNNMGLGRVWASVHFEKDHTEMVPYAKALVSKILRENRIKNIL